VSPGGAGSRRKLVLVMVDSLRVDMLKHAVRVGSAPTFGALLDRGTLVEDCVSTFPSVTPVASSEMTTGQRPSAHGISAVNWFHRVESRYVEYGSSFEATRTLGLIRTLYDIVYDMNMAHLSADVETVFERLGDADIRTACTPFLIYRGRQRHEIGLEGVLRRVALAASFRHAVWGPDELFYGELYASRKVPCKPTMARPGTRDEYSACVGRELARDGLYDFLLFSLPDNDHHSHRFGPEATEDSIAHADRSFAALVEASGGIDRFLDDNAVILLADHSQTPVEHELPLIELLAGRWRVLRPSAEAGGPPPEIAVSPSARAGSVYVLAEGRRFAAVHAGVRQVLTEEDGVDVTAWLADGSGPLERHPERAWPPSGAEAVAERDGSELRFRPGSQVRDPRGQGWDLDGDPAVLDLRIDGAEVDSRGYPDGLARLWAALVAPQAGDIMISLTEGYECVDWGGASHAGGGSHGALAAGDSVGPLLACGLEGFEADAKPQWTIADAAELVLGHYDLGNREDRTEDAVATTG
jgi:type I phosphodiesterase/nucleotide pyrophosphatase